MSIKREHEGDSEDYSDDGSNSGDDAPPPYSSRDSSSRLHPSGEAAVDYSVTSPGYSSTDSGSAHMSASGGMATPQRASRATGPRRSRNGVKVSEILL